jgi:hypothetical protein
MGAAIPGTVPTAQRSRRAKTIRIPVFCPRRSKVILNKTVTTKGHYAIMDENETSLEVLE